MPLNSSGPISLSGSADNTSIYNELSTFYKPSGGTLTGSISLQDKWVKSLAQKPSSNDISIPNDFYSKNKTPGSVSYKSFTVPVTELSYECNTGITNGPCTVVTDSIQAVLASNTGMYPLTYSWTHVSNDTGYAYTINSPTSEFTTFTISNIPAGDPQGTFVFKCTITDVLGSVNTLSNSITIKVLNTNPTGGGN